MSREAALKAWQTRKAHGWVPKSSGTRSPQPRASTRRIKGTWKPTTFQSQSSFWATPNYKGPTFKVHAAPPAGKRMFLKTAGQKKAYAGAHRARMAQQRARANRINSSAAAKWARKVRGY